MSIQHSLLSNLNTQQKAAVSAERSNLLILAGAGTGKTTVLVRRIAWLLEAELIAPRQILALTFTNKAAREMRDRIEHLCAANAQGLWAGTFHALCMRLLRAYAVPAGLDPNFTILDRDGQEKLIKRLLKEKSIDINECKPKDAADLISRCKERGLRPGDAALNELTLNGCPDFADLYQCYQQCCDRENQADFSELLLRTLEMLEQNPLLRELQHKRFCEILVDEFQDTNAIQYKLLRLLAGPKCHVMIVGDDDQSIYSWRGAQVANMRRFLHDFAPVRTLKLECNYRSGQYILDFANAMIAANQDRLENKQLRGHCGEGRKIIIHPYANPYFEAIGVAASIQNLIKEGMEAHEISVLYRNNYLSRAIETELYNLGIPSIVLGGQRFYDREEIQNVMAWLKLLQNERDDTALLRIINVPARKIGPKVIEQIQDVALERGLSLMRAISCIQEAAAQEGAAARVKTLARKLQPFYLIVQELQKAKTHAALPDLIEQVLTVSGLDVYYQTRDQKEGKKTGDNLRTENLKELVRAADSFMHHYESETEHADMLYDFIATASLLSSVEMDDRGNTDSRPQAVQLMTMHASKGLEFKAVFIIDFEQDILPSCYALEDQNRDGEEEERRLAYVGITRAREYLSLSYAQTRGNFNDSGGGVSSFIRQTVHSFSSLPESAWPFVIVHDEYS